MTQSMISRATLEQLRDEFDVLMARVASVYPSDPRTFTEQATELRSKLFTDALLSSSSSSEREQPPAHIIQLAIDASTCSPCRSKRGVAIFRGDNPVNTGHNYKPARFACDGSTACKATCRTEAIHAEQHALLIAGSYVAEGCDMLHVKTVDGALVPSGGPSCVQCSKLILASGIKGVWLYHADGWHRYDAAAFHQISLTASSGIAVPAAPERDELVDDLMSVLEHRPNSKGRWVHIGYCNTSERNPPGTPHVTCNCKIASRKRLTDLEAALRRIRGWDMLDATADGPYWKAKIDALLHPETAAAPEEQ